MAERERQDVMGLQERGSIVLARGIRRNFLEEWMFNVDVEGRREFSRQRLDRRHREWQVPRQECTVNVGGRARVYLAAGWGRGFYTWLSVTHLQHILQIWIPGIQPRDSQ